MNNGTANTDSTLPASRFGWLKLFGIILLASTLAIITALWAAKTYIFPSELSPVILSANEQQALDAKLQRLDTTQPRQSSSGPHKTPSQDTEGNALKPEAYTEDASKREIILSERELNALLAKNTDLAKKLAIDLSDNLASAKLLLPLDEEFPVLGGKTLKITAGLELAYGNNQPIVALKGISVWGVPIPNAWLGNLKNVNLINEFGSEKGFWQSFAAGIDDIEITDGNLKINLKE